MAILIVVVCAGGAAFLFFYAQKSKGSMDCAFGLCLGQTYDKTDASLEISQDAYRFTPKAPSPYFTSYSVSVHPGTKRIYAIAAGTASSEGDEDPSEAPEASPASGEQCTSQIDKLRGELESRYGTFSKDDESEMSLIGYTLSRDGRTINVSCDRQRSDSNDWHLRMSIADDDIWASRHEIHSEPQKSS